MKDYAKGKIYTIRCKKDDSLIYVGSTVQPLSRRLAHHKFNSNKYKERLFYSKIVDWDDWYIELYENFACKNNEELHKREGEIIRLIGTLNHQIAGRTKEQYIEENKEKKAITYKNYYEKNKETILQYHSTWRDENKEHLKEYERERKQKNREHILRQRKENYEKKPRIF